MTQITFTGTVIKKSTDKTVSVLVSRKIRHAKYGKQFTRSKKYLVHDELNSANIGDTVSIKSVTPISKRKRFALVTKKDVK